MVKESGALSVDSKDIFPIIKKWLYTDKDIFLRELVSNAVDAITKLNRLVSLGEANVEPDEKLLVKVILDKKQKTIQVIDNGIGMTADEIKKYINQVAFSGAQEFMERYKDQDKDNQIIGHFGLGFYSAFMVAETVIIESLSYQEGSEAVKWTCSTGTEFEMESSTYNERGTCITLYVAKDSEELLNYYELRRILEKYCAFLPVEIYLEDVEEKEKAEKEAAEKEAKKAAKEDEKEKKEEVKKVSNEAKEVDELGSDSEESKEPADSTEAEAQEEVEEDGPSEPTPINNTHPLWMKRPSECTDEEYKEFYHRVFTDYNDPLFWIHLNVDYPFKLKGILYFPKITNEVNEQYGQIKLYNNQVFVADNIKEVIPEYLLLLRGVIDCPDLPLNVSRSQLQNDGTVKKISEHISKKVADRLEGLFNNEREDYNKYWEDIHPFIKYGCMSDEKFYERMKDFVIFKTTNGEYSILKDYLDRNKDKHKNQVFYITDETQQAQYIKIFKDNELEAVYLTTMIDSPFINFLEMKEKDVKFSRVDADVSDALKDDTISEEDNKAIMENLEDLFKDILENDKLSIRVEALKNDDVPAMLLVSEQSRRMQEFSQRYGAYNPGMSLAEETLVLNSKNHLITKLNELRGREDKKDDIELIIKHVYDLAVLNNKPLEADQMVEFFKRSNKLLTKLAEME